MRGPDARTGAARANHRARARRVPPSISIQGWNPQTPYLKLMEASAQPYQVYLEQRRAYLDSPSFYLDCGDYLLRQGLTSEGLRVLSNLLEMALDNPPLLRMYAWRLQQAGHLDAAVQVLERVMAMRPDEPQSHRDLGLALSDRYQREGRNDDARRAADLLYEVAQRTWNRFPEIELIALMELNRLLEMARRRGLALGESYDSRLVALLDLDLRISLAWDADLTDVDLHVHEPTGEQAYYGHRQTVIGGLVSLDFTQGYGPEEYVLRRACPGVYTILARYYASHQQTLTGPCTVLATVYTDYARPAEQRQFLTLRLDQPGDTVPVGEVTIPGG